jgi:hypothetical protein
LRAAENRPTAHKRAPRGTTNCSDHTAARWAERHASALLTTKIWCRSVDARSEWRVHLIFDYLTDDADAADRGSAGAAADCRGAAAAIGGGDPDDATNDGGVAVGGSVVQPPAHRWPAPPAPVRLAPGEVLLRQTRRSIDRVAHSTVTS